MLASILIIAFSLALLVYWFRYSCILLLRNQSELAASSLAAADHRFHILEVQVRLRTEQQLDSLHTSLQRDYQVLTYLLQHAAGLELSSFEDRLLVLDYKVMRWWYQLTRLAAPDRARQALSEMALVLGILAGKIDERAGAHNEA
jgi:hypothetical protein